jgi:hypothetical protein
MCATKYYLDIFATLTTRRIAGWQPRAIEGLIRFNAIWFAIGVVVGDLFFVRHWLLASAVAVMPIAANNAAWYALSRRLATEGEREFSTVRRSGFRRAIAERSGWWEQMSGYGVAILLIGVLAERGIVAQTWPFALIVIGINMIKLYWSNCTKAAPGLRADLTRTFVIGERLEYLRRRRSTES